MNNHQIRFGIRRQLILAFSLIAILVFSTVALILYLNASRSLGLITENEIEQQISTVQEYIKTLSDEGDLLAGKYAKNPFFIQHLKIGDRESLAYDVEPIFKELSENNGVSVFEFGDQDGFVFFRGHNPEKYGEDKSGKAPIAKALDGGAASGLEFGSSGLAVRAFWPIESESQVIGTMQVGIDGDFVGEMARLTGSNILLFEGEELSKTNADEASLPESLLEHAGEAYVSFVNGESNYRYQTKDNDVFELVPLFDPTGEQLIGMVGIYKWFDIITDFERASGISLLIVSVLSILVTLVFASLISSYFSKPIKDMAEAFTIWLMVISPISFKKKVSTKSVRMK